jgi:tetratricopeptide (TPR) repeat protein
LRRAGALLLLALAIVAYLPAMNGAPIWDDVQFLFENPLLAAPDGLARIWLSTESHDYWPLSYTWLWSFRRAFGDYTLPYHLGNVALHALNGILIHRLLCKLDCKAPLVPAIAFVLHPVNVEAVAWMFQAKTLLASAFAFAACLAFLRYEESGSRRELALAIAAFTAAMLSKTSAAMFPLVFLLLSAWRHRTPTRRAWLASIPMLAIALALGAVSIWFHRLHYLVGTAVVRDDTLLERTLGAAWALWFYLYKAVLPIGLSFVYPRWEIDASSPLAWVPLAGAIASIFLLRRSRAASFALAFFAINLIPVLGFVDIPFMQFSLVADHWQYPAIAGPLALLSPLAERLREKQRIAAVVLLAIALGALAAQRASLFTDEISVYRDAAARAPDNFMVRLNLGKALAAQKDLDGAIAEFEAAARIAENADVLNNLGSALAEKSSPEEAAKRFRRALELDPGHVDANVNLGNLLLAIGRFEEAASHFARALERAPDHLAARTNLGAALATLGRFEEARGHLERAVALAPENVELLLTLARVQANAGDLPAAEATAKRALAIDANAFTANVLLGAIAAKRGDFAGARAHYDAALRTAPAEVTPQIRAAIEALPR